MTGFDKELMQLLLDALDGLPLVEKERMFGFEALWAEGRIFAVVWEGRIALRIPNPELAAELQALAGSRPFHGVEPKSTTARWIDVPESFHDDPHELRRWATRAYELALGQPPPRRKRARRKGGLQ